MNLREAAQQALEALAAWDALIQHQYSGTRVGMSDLSYAAQATPPVMEALRAALAEPVEYAVEPNGKRSPLLTHMMNKRTKEDTTLAEPEQEPVCDKDPRGCYSVRCQLGRMCKHTAPPQRKPLTDEEIRQAADQRGVVIVGEAMIAFARAIERAHGIGGG